MKECDNVTCCDGTEKCKEADCPSFTSSGKLEVCFVLDGSGSLCSKPGNHGFCSNPNSNRQRQACEFNNKKDKKDPSYCPKFNTHTKSFVKGFIDSMETAASNLGASAQYAITTFSSHSDPDQGLEDSGTTIGTVEDLSFEGGYTWTAHGMEKCQQALQEGEPDADKLIVLVMDGAPREDGSPEDYRTLTKNYAANIKAGKAAAGGWTVKEMKIMAIGVETTESDLDFVQELATPELLFEFSGYDALDDKVGSLVSNAVTQSCSAEVLSRSSPNEAATGTPASAPTITCSNPSVACW